MFNDPFGIGVAPFPLPSSGLVWRVGLGFVVAIPVRDEEERLPACLRALAQQRDQLGGRFRQPWSALSYSPTIAPTVVRASLDLWASVGRLASVSLKLHFPRRPRTLATPVVRRWISRRRGWRKKAKGAA